MGVTPYKPRHEQITITGTRPDGESFCCTCDKGVADIVRKLNEAGARTSYSCEATGSDKLPYIRFGAKDMSTLKRGLRILMEEYNKKHHIVLSTDKGGSITAYCYNREQYLRKWYSVLVASGKSVIVIPKEGENYEMSGM